MASPPPIGHPVAINIGPNPTFGEDKTKVEAHILDYSGDIYDSEITIELFEKLRDVQKFDSKERLLAQLAQDIAYTREIAKHRPGNVSG